ncbi:NAD-dependent epimerase/dehydratase family protein [Stackebrandtia nassauensis]|uniref:NAD-dependent epimerase/dehydratase n=1 Tax=Stackebrandtia nassauensis (strain DSM 44728 / CIP 108903 / NRRL B-16338 / NBRC 102104 / LLR-40K-21) TaxID=446470 RepID=D3PUR1_STANL|nr:NAD-dependent epimerase/dehydratase family protein [Stackebrandtia nassauensis]ADD44935.1 NAD-dependent epimerase/dehydratase [Stackebrandtia nassauensis DSM 44728]
MRVTIIGGTGHVGTFLVPRLVTAGHEVTVVSRGQRQPYRPHGAWRFVTTVSADRQAEEDAGTFGARIAALEPDVVIDMICFEPDSARQLVEALAGRVRHFLHCGTIWVYGPSAQVPGTEEQPRRAITEYGRKKAEIEAYLLDQAQRHGFPATVIHPGHISGPGWTPINPAGNLNLDVFQKLADGDTLMLPNLGMETLQHVHADDVAQVFGAAIANRSAALGESFNAVAATALTLRGYAEAAAGWFGQVARLKYLSWEEWRRTVDETDADVTHTHLEHSPHCSIDKARRLLGYRPRYSSLEATAEAVDRLVSDGQVRVNEST